MSQYGLRREKSRMRSVRREAKSGDGGTSKRGGSYRAAAGGATRVCRESRLLGAGQVRPHAMEGLFLKVKL